MKKQIFCPPLRDEFTKYGDKFTVEAKNEATGMYCYRRVTPEGSVYFEVFKAPITTGPDGSRYEYYPRSSHFGFGSALCIRGDEKRARDKVDFYLRNGFDAGRYVPGASTSAGKNE